MGRLLGLAVFLLSTFAFAGANPPPKLKPVPEQNLKADPLLKKFWHLDQIGAEDAWKTSLGSPEVIVSVVDSGIDYNHPDLAPNLHRKNTEWPMDGFDSDGNEFEDDVIGWDFVQGGPLPFDRSGHGTFMASIIAAAYNNGVGGAGVCPKCSLMTARFINWEGLGDTEDAILKMRF